MSPEFASAVDPIFLHVIGSLERIRNGDRIDPQQLQANTQAKVRMAAEALQSGPLNEAWRLAMYGLCAWIDDVMINLSWEGQRWWENHKLEFQFFNTNEAGTAFFRKAKEAQQLPRRDAIEVFYIAVILGFRGLYALPDGTAMAHQYDLPPTIDDWARRTSALVQPGTSAMIKQTPIPVEGAPALEGRFTIVGAGLLFFILFVLAILLGYRILVP